MYNWNLLIGENHSRNSSAPSLDSTTPSPPPPSTFATRGDRTSLEQPSNHPKYYYRSSRLVFIWSNQPWDRQRSYRCTAAVGGLIKHSPRFTVFRSDLSRVSARITLSIVGGLSNEPRTRFALIALDRRRRNATVALHSAACRLFAGNARRGTKLVETNPECSPSWRNSCLFSSRRGEIQSPACVSGTQMLVATIVALRPTNLMAALGRQTPRVFTITCAT